MSSKIKFLTLSMSTSSPRREGDSAVRRSFFSVGDGAWGTMLLLLLILLWTSRYSLGVSLPTFIASELVLAEVIAERRGFCDLKNDFNLSIVDRFGRGRRS